MGAQVDGGAGWLEVRRGAWPLKAITLDCNHIPDAAMTLAVMALYADGTTRLTNIASWRVKETDRIAAMAAELRKMGATVVEGADFIEVSPPASPAHWLAGAIHTYDDHRMAMCLSLAAFNPLAGAKPPRPVRILDPQCVAKTFPDYFEALFGLAKADAADVPVITIDGPTASGKGTLASEVARRLGFELLDSGALYRATALAVQQAGADPADAAAVAALAGKLDLRFEADRAFLDGQDVTDALRLEETGNLASKVSVHPAVRQALHGLQLAFRRLPGLVADGRDMGTIIFPDAPLKIFLTASVEQRASRRHNQLISRGISANIDSLLTELQMRDARDQNRAVAPLKPAEDAVLLDNSGMSIDECVEFVLEAWNTHRSQ
jgi:3-phosphoshikimate 1-carboxyvinyltransferase